jgi:outer membrane autotransporter protein
VNDVDFDSNGFAFAGSLELGYPVALEQGFTIEPQVQLVGQSLDLDGGSDGFSDISFDDTASLAGRAGVRLAKTWANPETPTMPLTAWVRGDVWHEFLDAPEVTFASDVGDATFVSGPDDTWFGARLGLSGLATANLQLQASAGTQISADGSGIGYDGTIGFVLNW